MLKRIAAMTMAAALAAAAALSATAAKAGPTLDRIIKEKKMVVGVRPGTASSCSIRRPGSTRASSPTTSAISSR